MKCERSSLWFDLLWAANNQCYKLALGFLTGTVAVIAALVTYRLLKIVNA